MMPRLPGDFSVKTGTVMQARSLPIGARVFTPFLSRAGPGAKSPCALACRVDVAQKAPWLLVARRVREGRIDCNDGTLAGVGEVGETSLGGKCKSRHARMRRELSGGLAGKMPLAGTLHCGGKTG